MKALRLALVVWFPIFFIWNLFLYKKIKDGRIMRFVVAAIATTLTIVFYPLVVIGLIGYVVYRIDKRVNPEPDVVKDIPAE
jgi:hypothetical protein